VDTTTAADRARAEQAAADKAASDRADLRAWLPGYLSLAVIWGSSFLFIKVGIRELHPLYVTLGRVVAGALALLAVLLVTRGRLPRDPRVWGHLAVIGTIGVAIPFTLFGYGEQRVTSALAGIWNATTPLLALPIAVLVFRTERVTWRRGVGLLVGFTGVLVVLGVWQGVGGAHLTGQLMCGGAALCYAIVIPYQRRFLGGLRGSGVAVPAGQLLVGTAVLLVVAPLVAGAPPAPTALSVEVVGSVLALGVFGTGLAFLFMFRVITRAGASTAASVTYLLPIVATLLGVVVLGEQVRWHQPVGAALVLVGIAVSQGALRVPRRWRRERVASFLE
jgi:drug/metabolite transporter (DMT)-like permease